MAKPRPKEVHYSSSAVATTAPVQSNNFEVTAEEAEAVPAASTTAPNDPYLELELYFEKVNAEIGAVFDNWHEGGRNGVQECYPDVIQQDGTTSYKQKGSIRKKKPISIVDTNHLDEFERVVADELLALTPSSSEASDASTPSLNSYGQTTLENRYHRHRCRDDEQNDGTNSTLLPDLLAVRQHDLVCASGMTKATALLKQKEVENFLRKVEHTILGQEATTGPVGAVEDTDGQCIVQDGADSSPALDAGTQTQDLSRSSSVIWLSSSSLLDSPASAASRGSTREETSSTEDTSSSSEALLASGRIVNARVVQSDNSDAWLRLRTASGDVRSQEDASLSSVWNETSEPVWQPQLRVSSMRPDSSTSLEPEKSSSVRDGAVSDNEMANHRKRKYQQTGRIPENAKPQQTMQSPSLSSLHSLRATVAQVGTPLAPELATKSSSAPVLAKQQPCITDSTTIEQDNTARNFVSHRSHSERHLSEIEALEACRWMRAAGFPQYAQMFEDFQFPVDLTAVQKDHPFLDRDALQALFRRLHILNRCAKLRVDGGAHAKNPAVYDSDDEVECALSENWTFLPQSRRWSRIAPLTDILQQGIQDDTDELNGASLPGCSFLENKALSVGEGVHGSDAEVLENEEEEEEAAASNMSVKSTIHNLRQYSSLPPGRVRTSTGSDSEFQTSQSIRRSGSDKIRDGAKAILRRVESLKRGKRQKQSSVRTENPPLIGQPQVIDVAGMQDRMRTMNCVDIVSNSKSETLGITVSDEASNAIPHDLSSDNVKIQRLEVGDTECKSPPVINTPWSSSRDNDAETQSDTECLSSKSLQEEEFCEKFTNNNNITEMSHSEPRRKSFRKRYHQQPPTQINKESSLSLDLPRHKSKSKSELGRSDNDGIADLSPDVEEEKLHTWEQRLMKPMSEKSPGEVARGQDEDSSVTSLMRQKVSVLRWHSFGRGSGLRRPSCKPDTLSVTKTLSNRKEGEKVSITSLSCGQLMVLRQLATLQLTAILEKHCTALRSTGFNWELPKFMKKCKSPQKDQNMFGVSLISSLQSTGHALPPAIQAAMQYLTDHALDHVGLFRKSGVKSRIQKLKLQIINTGLNEPLNFTLEEQQAYDVADVIKQFFRELPEALLTSKLSDTFLAIFQHMPVSSRHEAVRWAILLLPDQHREVLQFLLLFLNTVALHSSQNQMTASNLAVCLAPSLFHSNSPMGSGDTPDCQRCASPRSRSKRRTKSASAGSPDAKELTESRAAHDCLLYLINNIDDLVTVSEDLLSQCHFSWMEQSIPLSLGELGGDIGQDWKGYMQACTTALLKEIRERQRGWVTVSSSDTQVEVSYKKVGDGHPLRIWRVSTEVEAPPAELLHRILRERYLWDPSLLKCRVVSKPELNSEVYHYVCASMKPLPPRDYCVLRSWRSDLPRGGCILVETSIDFPGCNELVPGTVQAVVLASRYLIEPCGSGRSRVLHLSRVDTKGRSVEWYNKCYGHICALDLSRIRTSFSHSAEGQESKV